MEADRRMSRERPRLSLVGTFDLANYGDLLLPAVAERELLARVPDLDIRRYSPYGWEHPVPMDAGELAEPLGPATAERQAWLADRSDLVLIGGGEILHFRDEFLAPHYGVDAAEITSRSPSTWFFHGAGPAHEVATAWNAVGIPFDIDDEHASDVRASAERFRYLAVRDDISHRRLRDIGVDRDIAVVPDPALLVDRLFDAELLERRRRFHEAMGWSPDGPYVVVHGSGPMVPDVERISAAVTAGLGERPDIALVGLELGEGHGDRAFLDALAARHPGPIIVPDVPLLPADVAAVIAGAETYVGVSMHGAVTAMAYGRRAVVFNATKQSKHRGLVAHLDDRSGLVEDPSELPAALRWALAPAGPDPALPGLRDRIDRHFDRIAEIVEDSVRVRGTDTVGSTPRIRDLADELRRTREAHRERGRRLLADRNQLTAMLDEARDEADDLHARVEILERQVRDLRNERDEVVETARRIDQSRADHTRALDAERAETAALRAELDAIHASGPMRVRRLLAETWQRVRRRSTE